MPIQLRCFNNIWPFFTNVALCRCGSYTHGFQRLMVSTEIIKNWGGQNGGGKKIIWGGGICPPLPPPLAPPLFISANNVNIISTDEDPSLRIESSAIINLRRVSTKLNKYIVFTMQTYKKLITDWFFMCFL